MKTPPLKELMIVLIHPSKPIPAVEHLYRKSDFFEKRKSEHLGPSEIVWVRHGFSDEVRLLLAPKNCEGRDAQTKIIAVQYLKDFFPRLSYT